MITPSTPAATTRSRSAGSSTVQASTCAPERARGARPHAGVTSACWSIKAVAPALTGEPRHDGRHRRAQSSESPSARSGGAPGAARDAVARSSGYVTPIRTVGACRRDARAGSARGTTRRPSVARHRSGASAAASSSRRVVSFRSTCSPTLGRLVDEERERLVERRQVGRDLAKLVERARLCTEPVAAPWLTSSSRSEWASTSGPRGRSSTSNSIRSTPCASGRAKGAERVLGREMRPRRGDRCGAPSRPPRAELDHAALRRAAAEPPPRERPPSTTACVTVSAAASCETSCPEALRVQADERVGVARTATSRPSKNISWKRVKKRSKPSRISGTARARRQRRERAEQQPARDDGAEPRPRERERERGEHEQRDELARSAPPKTRADVPMCESSRSSNAGEPSGRVARSSSTIPSRAGRIERRPSSASDSRCALGEAVPVGGNPSRSSSKRMNGPGREHAQGG